MIRDYGEKRIKAPSLDMKNTEQISHKVGALPHSTLGIGRHYFRAEMISGFKIETQLNRGKVVSRSTHWKNYLNATISALVSFLAPPLLPQIAPCRLEELFAMFFTIAISYVIRRRFERAVVDSSAHPSFASALLFGAICRPKS